MTQKQRRDAGDSAPSAPDFDPVPLRARRDGWTVERQRAFVGALAETGCVLEACRRVGMSSASAYKLARRPDAQGFRAAWKRACAVSTSRRRLSPEPKPPRFLNSSTSAAAGAETNGKCPGRHLHQLPPDHQLPAGPEDSAPPTPRRAPPAYSLESFLRAARRSTVNREPQG